MRPRAAALRCGRVRLRRRHRTPGRAWARSTPVPLGPSGTAFGTAAVVRRIRPDRSRTVSAASPSHAARYRAECPVSRPSRPPEVRDRLRLGLAGCLLRRVERAVVAHGVGVLVEERPRRRARLPALHAYRRLSPRARRPSPPRRGSTRRVARARRSGSRVSRPASATRSWRASSPSRAAS
jgi:hypothetical protein